MYFRTFSLRILLSKSAVLTFLTIFPAFLATTVQASTGLTAEVSVQTSKKVASPEVVTTTYNKYVTTSGGMKNLRSNVRLDQNIIFSMMLVIFLGFLTLFSAVGYQRSSSLQKTFRLFQLQK